MRIFLAAPVLAAALLLLGACSDRDGTELDGLTSTVAAESPTATSTSPTQGATPSATAPAPAHPEFVSSRAMAHVEALSVEIGERVSGTAAEREATAYIADELRSYGYDAEIIDFEYDGERYRLSMVGLPEMELSGFALVGSESGTVEGEAVFLGLGDDDGYLGKTVAGKVAVVDRGVLSFRDKYEEALDRGAIGMVVINDEPRALAFANLDTRSRFPVVGVSGEARDALITLAEAGGSLAIEIPNDEVAPAQNVLAMAPGTDRCTILVGGHHDTVPASPGANDNASGVAHVLELARALAADGLDEGLCFATFGAEEHGLFGSAEMARAMREDEALPGLMVNLDVTGIGDVVEAIGGEVQKDAAIAAGSAIGVEVVSSQLPPNTGSDHQSFAAAGVDVLFFTSGGHVTIHTPQDVFADVQEEEMERVGQAALAYLLDELDRFARGEEAP